ncbi:MAG: flagellin, partial [Gammaproteobacteria bacterium]
SAQQGELGAVGNRLEGADRSLQASRVEVARAESRISDAEIAVEISMLLREQIMQKAASAAMIQANLESGRALELIGAPAHGRRAR